MHEVRKCYHAQEKKQQLLKRISAAFFSRREFVRAINVCTDETMVMVLHSQQTSLIKLWLSTAFNAMTSTEFVETPFNVHAPDMWKQEGEFIQPSLHWFKLIKYLSEILLPFRKMQQLMIPKVTILLENDAVLSLLTLI